jgi:hypothetical protein
MGNHRKIQINRLAMMPKDSRKKKKKPTERLQFTLKSINMTHYIIGPCYIVNAKNYQNKPSCICISDPKFESISSIISTSSA